MSENTERAKARQEAVQELQDRHRNELLGLIEERYKLHGLTYRRRLTDEEKAAKQLAELRENFPRLFVDQG